MTTLRIYCNGSRVYLQPQRDGSLQVEADTMSEQCEGCGHDISETGRFIAAYRNVKCSACGLVYAAQPA